MQGKHLAVIVIPVMAFSLSFVICSMGAACFVFVLHACLPADAADETTNCPAAGIDSTTQLAWRWIDSSNRDCISNDLPILAIRLD